MNNTNVYTDKYLATLGLSELVDLYNESTNDWQKNKVLPFAKDELKIRNASKVNAVIADLARGDVKNFVLNQFTLVDKFTFDEDGVLSLEEDARTVRVPLAKVEKLRKENKEPTLVADKTYVSLVKRFTDNLAQNLALPLEDEDDKTTERIAKFEGVLYFARTAGKKMQYRFNEYSKAALTEQLDAIFAFILGTDACIRATKKDVSFILAHCSNAVSGVHGVTKVKSASRIIPLILSSLYCRMTGKEYTVITSAKQMKEKAEKKAEEAIAKTAPKCPNAFTGKNGESEKEVAEKQATADSAREVSVKPETPDAKTAEKNLATKKAAELKAKRSAAAKKGVETRKRNAAKKSATAETTATVA